MINLDKLKRVALVGGGRWARVTLGVLHDILPISTALTIHSPNNSNAMELWACEIFGERPFSVTDALPYFDNPSNSALIVVNAARDHVTAVQHGLAAGVPVLVEKPLALNAKSVNGLIDLAERRNTPLAVAHVFRFAKYVQNFASMVHLEGKLSSLRVEWEDSRVEKKYGEVKSYDSSISVCCDSFPHVFSIIAGLMPVDQISIEKLIVRRGGAEVESNLLVNQIPVTIVSARNAEQRKRYVEATMDNGGKLILDFQHEPGFIHTAQGSVIGDEFWSESQRPLTSMLSAFLSGVCQDDWDIRMSPNLALRVAELIDNMHADYLQQILNWTEDELKIAGSFTDAVSLSYSLRELLQTNNYLPENVLENRVQMCLASRTLNFQSFYGDKQWTNLQ